MKKTTFLCIFCGIAGCFAVKTANAQLAWTPEQKAVWKTESAITDFWLKGDMQSGLAYYDDSYNGWSNNAPVPTSKSNMITRMNYAISQGGKMVYWDAVPIIIWVNGNYAYTDYYYTAIYESKEGKKTTQHGKWLDVLMKKDGKWLLVGDHGGADPEPKK